MQLLDFQIIRPQHESTQENGLEWFAQAHTKAESREGFRETIREKLWHVGCKPDKIAKRGHVLADYLHLDWEKMQVYRLHENPAGENISIRSKIYQEEVESVFERFFPEGSSPPDDLIHVSCTGYVSPSGAQALVSKRNWGEKTTVTHAYHMGCYGSIPAIRMGIGFLQDEEKKINIVHTEICSLHNNFSRHETHQLVSQSLFADGFIKYSMVNQSNLPSLQVMRVKEEIIPNSRASMTWEVAPWGFEMFLGKEVGVLIARHLPGYLERIKAPKNAIFAIHPGGPKILEYIQKALGLKDDQLGPSYEILKNYGNMSSATLPHIWEKILNDASVPFGTPIVSLAFGPGLSFAGAVMEKRCGS